MMTDAEGGSHISHVMGLFRAHGRLSRAEVMQLSGLSRSTINQRLAALAASGLITQIDGGESTGGRPSSLFELNRTRAVLLTVDIGASGFTAAVCDLAGTPLRHVTHAIDVWEGPQKVLSAVQAAFDELTDDASERPGLSPVEEPRSGVFKPAPERDEIWGIGVGVPGPVEFAAGRVVNPPIMTGWDRFDIAGWFAGRYSAPVVVENDANARAVKEARLDRADNLISLKLGTGIGSGLVFNGQIIRGSEGAAGDIGHTRAATANDLDPLPCRCGNVGCVEAYAGGWALVRDLNAAGVPVANVAGVVELVWQGNIDAVRLVRQAGRVLGDAVAALVSILNPGTIVLSGQLSLCDEVLLSGIRERVYQRSLPLATRNLVIRTSDLGELVGVSGLALITADRLFGIDMIDALL